MILAFFIRKTNFFLSLLLFYAICSNISYANSQRLYTPLDNFIELPTIEVGGFIHSKAGHSLKRNKAYKSDLLPDYDYNFVDGSHDIGGIERISFGTANRSADPGITNDAEVYIKASGTSDFGSKYGAIFQLEASTASSFVNQLNASRAYFFIESLSGKVEIGDNIGVNQQMKVGPANFARGAGGINGKYLQHVNFPMMRFDETLIDPIDEYSVFEESKNGSCPGYPIYALHNFDPFISSPIKKYSTFRDECGFYKLPSFIILPQAPVSHGGYGRGFYNSNLTFDDELQNYFSTYAGDYSYNRQREDITLRDGSFGQMENSSKLTYYTPRVYGWQLGSSYSPDTGNKGSYLTGNANGDLKNVISWGLNYADNIGNLGLAFSLTGEHGKAEQINPLRQDAYGTGFVYEYNNTKRNNLEAYEAGLVLNFFGFSLGASYGLWGASLNPKSGPYSCDYGDPMAINYVYDDESEDDGTISMYQNSSGEEFNYWTYCDTYGKKLKDSYYGSAGLGYEFGPFAASLTAIKSRFQMNEYEAASLGIDYKLAKGVLFYIEGTYFKFASNHANFNINDVVDDVDDVNGGVQTLLNPADRLIIDNDGYVGLVGFLFSF